MRRRQQRRQQAGLTAPAATPLMPGFDPETEPEPVVVTMDEVQEAAIDLEQQPATVPLETERILVETKNFHAVEAEQMETEEAVTATDPFATVYPFEDGETDALVIRCADPRFRDAFIKFEEDIGVFNPAVIAITGSVKAFGLQLVIPKEWHGLRKQLELITSRHAHVPRVILFTHEDCRSYAQSWAKGMLRKFSDVVGAQKGHLAALAGYLKKEYLPKARFELYHAVIVEDAKGRGVKFEKVAEL